MTILKAGNEWDTFIGPLPGVTVETGSGEFDSNFSRVACELGSNTANPPYQLVDGLGNLPEIWVHMRCGTGNHQSFAAKIMQIYNSANVGILRLTATDPSAGWRFEYWNGSVWTMIGAAYTGAFQSVPHDFRCKIDNTVGAFEWWINGVLERSFTGDTDLIASAGCDDVRIGGFTEFVPSNWTEFIVADVSTLGMRVATLVANGNGANTAWTGGYTDIDENNINDADFISSATATQVETFTLSDLSTAAAALTPVAVVNSFRARNGASGPQNIDPALRTGGTNYFGSSVPGLSTSFSSGYFNVWQINPNTGLDWTVSDINGLELGARSAT